MIAFLARPLAKYIGLGVVIVLLVAAGAWAASEHSAHVRLKAELAQTQANLAQKAADDAQIIESLQADKTRSDARAARIKVIKEAINNAPQGMDCNNPGINAALDGLRNDPDATDGNSR